MTTGSLLKLETSTQTPSNGVMQIVANSVTSGTIIRASGTSVNDGNVGRIVTNGIRAGNGLLIEGGSGTTMTTGSLLKLETSTQTPSNGVMQIVANSVTNGKVLKISGTNSPTDGSLMEIVGGSSQSSTGGYRIAGTSDKVALSVDAGDVDVAGYLSVGGGMQVTATPISALGTDESDAAQLNDLDSVVVVTATGEDMGVLLPSPSTGKSVRLIRSSANHGYNIYPSNTNQKINGNSSYFVNTTETITTCICVSSTAWSCTVQSTTGGSTLTTLSLTDDITLANEFSQISHIGSGSLTISMKLQMFW